ncbi:MAG: hypothetical protein R3F34_15925 [Planctomycetota bacterium]
MSHHTLRGALTVVAASAALSSLASAATEPAPSMIGASVAYHAELSFAAAAEAAVLPQDDVTIINPANQHPRTGGTQEPKSGHSWEVPETVVVPGRGEHLREEDRIGDYGQPRWTARRLFPTTRVYVRPAGQVEFEHWTRAKVPRDGGKSTVEHQYEVEMGLGHRLQLDIYFVTEKSGSEGEIDTSENKFEVRYALADWGEILLNPTIYVEWVERSGKADKLETKLLLAEELAPSWHFGANLVLEHEVSGDLENEYGLSLGIAKTIIDEKLSIGIEVKSALVDVHADRGEYTKELEIGPTIQFRPTPQMHIDFAPLIGIGGDSRAADIFLVVGWEF